MPNWRIMVVDDDPDIRKLIVSSLAPDYEVIEAKDGLDALEMLNRTEPDLVILDVMMPLMDGIQTCQAIRRHPRFSNLTVLFLTALSSNGDIRKGYDSGANLYLTKPFDPQRLRRNVDLFFEKQADQAPTNRRYSIEELSRLNRTPTGVCLTEAVSASPMQDASETRPRMPRVSGVLTQQPVRPRVMAVDDDPQICHLINEALHSNYEVFTACDGLDAIGKITAYQPDVILIDTLMPRLSGYQLCQSLRRNARYARTPIILASSKHSAKDRDYSMRIGGNYFLQKPFTAIEVLEAVRDMVSHPNFRLAPKSLTAAQINDLEQNSTTNTEQTAREVQHTSDVHEMEEFLKRHVNPYAE